MSPEDIALLNKVTYTAFFIPLLLCGILIWFLVHYQKRKHQSELREKESELRISKLRIQKQQALQAERSRIAGEMHDDLGSGLTKIKFLGQRMIKKVDNLDQKEKLTKIVENSQALVTNMSEIIWAMNAGFDNLESTVAYCRRYAKEYLSDHELALKFENEIVNRRVGISGEKRRHLFLVYKEILHNIVKHADAEEVRVLWQSNDQNLFLFIEDDGRGFDDYDLQTGSVSGGNGLFNIRKRVSELNGKIHWSSNSGTQISITLPILNLGISIAEKVNNAYE